MKKNYMMRLAAVLLVLVLLSTCVISGTFAKYTTAGTATDSATVAKWGVKITAETKDNNEYEADFGSVDGQVIVNADVKTLAPGVGVNFASINITGTPEVEVKVTYAATLELTGWSITSGEYMPLVFVINGEEYSFAGVGAANIDAFEAKIAEIIAAYSQQYDEGTDLSTKAVQELTVSCYWAFSTSEENDVKDTALGDLATAPTVNLTITCTVTQVD